MRFLHLSLKAVGPFTSAELDLSGGRQGLHLIHGPNEAGKTSALRALSYLLFGFPVRTDDAFVHPYDQLRVGATLQHSDGEVLQVVRRKGSKNTLRAADDATVIGPGVLERFLGGIDQETFENLFGIDHARLRHAGEEIRTGQGRLGELLFAAGTGLAGLSQAKQRLQDRLDLLFRPRGQNQKINQALTEYREAQEAIKRVQLPGEEWLGHDLALREAQEQADQLVERIHSARRALNRQTRIRDAIPLVARRRRLREELDRLGHAVRLRDSFGTEARAAQDALHQARCTIDQAGTAIDEIDQRLGSIEPCRGLLDAADEIEALKEKLGAVEKALEDRPRLESYKQEREHTARQILVKLGRPRDLDAADDLRLRADEPTRIRALGQRFTELRVQRDETRSSIARHEDQLTRLARDRATLGEPRDATALRRAVRQARKAGDLDTSLAQAAAACDRSDQQARQALDRLPGWSRGLEDLEQQAVPVDPTIDRFEAELLAVDQELRRVDDQRSLEDDAIRQLEAQLRALDIQQDVPTEDDLKTARRRRDEGWRLLRPAASGGTGQDKDSDPAPFVNEFAPGRTLADAFEQSLIRADAIADRLRREAERVARKAEWLAQLEGHRNTREGLARGRRETELLRDRRREGWAMLVAPLGVPMESPPELRAWIRLRNEVVQLAEQARLARQARDALDQSRTEHRTALVRALGGLGTPSPEPAESLAALLDRAESVLEQEERSSQRRQDLERQSADLEVALTRDRLRLQTTDDELSGWRVDWSAMMARIGLESDATPEQAEVVLTEMQDLHKALSARREFLSRIRGMDRDAEQFADLVAHLCRRVAPELEGQTPSARARELARRLRDEQNIEQERTILSQNRAGELQRRTQAEQDRDTAMARLERLCREAGCASPDDLAEAERRSRDRARLEDDLQACEDQLLALGGGSGAAEFALQVEQADLDALGPDIARRETEIGALETELHAVKETIGAERGELNRWVGGDDAALAAEKAQSVVARLQADVAQYAKLRLAASVLNRSIEKYRDKSQGPVLTRASELFRTLTDGSFIRLQIEDEDGRALLKGARPEGRLVGVEGMSDGSHDQLYLALRLASLEAWLQAHEAIPFVVDDILLNFDDGRALAALRALAELSRRTQVLFFTHHAHLVELARTELPPDVLFLHELPRP